MKVSIIIPIYNVSAYIAKCLDTVFVQTYDDIEVVLVDDCGTDDSIDIAQKIAAKFGNRAVVWVKNDHNRGLSYSRNQGIIASSGDYLYFLDSDDYLVPDCIERMVSTLHVTESADMVIADYCVENGNDLGYHVPLEEGRIVGNEDIRTAYFSYRFFTMAWNKLVRKSFIIDYHLFFCNGLIHEDNIWSFQLACFAQTINICKAVTYIHIINDNSIMTTGGFERHQRAYMEVSKQQMEFVAANKIKVDAKMYAYIESFKKNKMMMCFWNNMPELGKVMYHSYRQNAYPLFAKLSLKQRFFELHRILPEKYGLIYYIKCSF